MRVTIHKCDKDKKKKPSKVLDDILKQLERNNLGCWQAEQGRRVTITGIVKAPNKPTR